MPSACCTSVIPVLTLWPSANCGCVSPTAGANPWRVWGWWSPFHLYPCIKYERVSPAAQLSAPPVCSVLCNGLISAWVAGEPRRLLIYSWLFKDLFVSWGCCLRRSQASICGKMLGNGKCVHSSQRAPHLQRDWLERFKSSTNVIS